MFDGEVLENLGSREKLLRKFKRTRLRNDKELYEKLNMIAANLITAKNQAFLMKNSHKKLANLQKIGTS